MSNVTNEINRTKMVNYIIETNKLFQENILNNTVIMSIIDKIFLNKINPYSKKVLKNIIAKILNNKTIGKIEKNIIINILDELKKNELSLTNIDIIMYIIDKIYLYNIDNIKV